MKFILMTFICFRHKEFPELFWSLENKLDPKAPYFSSINWWTAPSSVNDRRSHSAAQYWQLRPFWASRAGLVGLAILVKFESKEKPLAAKIVSQAKPLSLVRDGDERSKSCWVLQWKTYYMRYHIVILLMTSFIWTL